MKWLFIALFIGLVIFKMSVPDNEVEKYNPPQYVPPCVYEPDTNEPIVEPCK